MEIIHHMPMDAVFFLTIYDDWGRAKLQRFKTLGLSVEVMWERPPRARINGEKMRRAMADKRDWSTALVRTSSKRHATPLG